MFVVKRCVRDYGEVWKTEVAQFPTEAEAVEFAHDEDSFEMSVSVWHEVDEVQTMITVAKMTDGRVVEVVRVAETVGFSPEKGWVMVCMDFEKTFRKRTEFKWVPATTPFVWVREFVFG